jgi:hypothetical protein
LKHRQIQSIGGKLIKDMRTVIFILLMVFCYSCMDIFYMGDVAYPIRTNERASLEFNSECGKVDIVSLISTKDVESVDKAMIFLRHHFYTDQYTLCPDSFRVISESDYCKIGNIYFLNRKKGELSRKTKGMDKNVASYLVSADETIFVSFEIIFSKNWDEDLMILPCNYIMCKETPLITDTIRISLK